MKVNLIMLNVVLFAGLCLGFDKFQYNFPEVPQFSVKYSARTDSNNDETCNLQLNGFDDALNNNEFWALQSENFQK